MSVAPDHEVDEEAARLIGFSHAYAHAIVQVKMAIGRIGGPYAPRILPHHTRKLAAREDILRPLRELKSWLTDQHASTQAAYRRRTDG